MHPMFAHARCRTRAASRTLFEGAPVTPIRVGPQREGFASAPAVAAIHRERRPRAGPFQVFGGRYRTRSAPRARVAATPANRKVLYSGNQGSRPCRPPPPPHIHERKQRVARGCDQTSAACAPRRRKSDCIAWSMKIDDQIALFLERRSSRYRGRIKQSKGRKERVRRPASVARSA